MCARIDVQYAHVRTYICFFMSELAQVGTLACEPLYVRAFVRTCLRSLFGISHNKLHND